MKLGTRLFVLLALPLVTAILLFAWLSQRESRAVFQDELSRAGRLIGRVTQLAMEDYLRDHQDEDARELVDRITGYERVLGFRLFDPGGRLLYESRLPEGSPAVDPAALQRVLTGALTEETQTALGEQPVVAFLFPLSGVNGERLGAVQVLELESFLLEAERAARRSFLILTLAVVAATGAVILAVTRYSVQRPIDGLVRGVRTIAAGAHATRVPVSRDDEIGRLASEFNAMCDRLDEARAALAVEQEERRRSEAGLRRAERLASVGRLAAGLAHEIGTPLNVIGGRAEALLRKLDGNEVADRNLTIIVAQIDRISRIVREMLDFARERESRPAEVKVDAVVAATLELIELQADKQQVRVVTELAPDLPAVIADADQLHQVCLNLATNALDAMPSGGSLIVRASRVRRANAGGETNGEFVAVEFEDTGTGISPENLERIFDPFFTTKDVGSGTGLGLAVTYGIVREHGGFIDAKSVVGRGTTLSVLLPVPAAPRREDEA